MWPFSKSYTQPDLDRAVSEAMGTAYGHANDILTDYVQEASQSAESVLAREDRGWTRLAGADGSLTDAQRQANVVMARLYWNLDVMCKQLVNLWAYFGVGSGITYQVEGDRAEPATDVLDEYMGAKRNRVALSNQGQMRTAIKLLTDGEVFRPFFGEREITVRWIDPIQVSIASDPDDKFTARWYLRQWCTPKGEMKAAIYRDRNNEDGKPGILSDGKEVADGDSRIVPDVVVAHTVINTLDVRGHSLLTPVLDWSKAHRKFMRARVAVQQSLARFAAKVTSKGTQTQLTALANKLDSTLATGSEDNPPPAPGSFWYENANTNMQSLRQETGATAAQVDGTMLLQMVGLGAGVFPHYLGAGEAFRLATATAMESPMLRGFETFRSLLHDTYKDDLKYVLAQAGIDAEVQVDSQTVIAEETNSVVNAFEKLLMQFPSFVDSEAVQKRALNILGIDNAEAVLQALSDEAEAQAAPRTTTERAILHRFFRMLQETKGGSGYEGCNKHV